MHSKLPYFVLDREVEGSEEIIVDELGDYLGKTDIESFLKDSSLKTFFQKSWKRVFEKDFWKKIF